MYLAGATSGTATRTIWARSVSGTGTVGLLSYHSNQNRLFTVTEEWQRFEISGTTTPIGDNNFYAVDFRDTAQTLSEVIIWGAQSEEATYATSYIPTNGSSQTRAAETCNGAGTSSIFESSEGILYCEIAALANDGTARQISLSDGSSSTNKVSILYTSTTNQIKAFIRGGGSVALNTTHTLSNALQFNKIALKYKVNDFSLYVNGTEVRSDTSGAIPTALSDLSLDDADGTQDFYGKIRDIRVYNTKEMTDSEVDILLTKITS